MSDLVSVFLYVVQDEVDAFWLFANWMDELEGVFSLHQPGMLTKLSALGVLIRFVEPSACGEKKASMSRQWRKKRILTSAP